MPRGTSRDVLNKVASENYGSASSHSHVSRDIQIKEIFKRAVQEVESEDKVIEEVLLLEESQVEEILSKPDNKLSASKVLQQRNDKQLPNESKSVNLLVKDLQSINSLQSNEDAKVLSSNEIKDVG